MVFKTELDKVIDGLQRCSSGDGEKCTGCPYGNVPHADEEYCSEVLMGDAARLLRIRRADRWYSK